MGINYESGMWEQISISDLNLNLQITSSTQFLTQLSTPPLEEWTTELRTVLSSQLSCPLDVNRPLGKLLYFCHVH